MRPIWRTEIREQVFIATTQAVITCNRFLGGFDDLGKLLRLTFHPDWLITICVSDGDRPRIMS